MATYEGTNSIFSETAQVHKERTAPMSPQTQQSFTRGYWALIMGLGGSIFLNV